MTELCVLSRSGRDCRLKYPGLANAKLISQDGEDLAYQTDGPNVMFFPTDKGVRYAIQLQP
jgi:hypothetical protein